MIKINAHRVGQVSLIRWAYKFYPLKLDSWILVRQITFLDNHLLPNYIYICPFCCRSDFGSQMSCICWFPKLIHLFQTWDSSPDYLYEVSWWCTIFGNNRSITLGKVNAACRDGKEHSILYCFACQSKDLLIETAFIQKRKDSETFEKFWRKCYYSNVFYFWKQTQDRMNCMSWAHNQPC